MTIIIYGLDDTSLLISSMRCPQMSIIPCMQMPFPVADNSPVFASSGIVSLPSVPPEDNL